MALSFTSAAGEYTLADLHAMPDDGHRYELIGGSIVMSPPPLSAHQRAARRLFSLVNEACPDGHEVFFAPIDLLIGDRDEVEPDLVVVPSANAVRRGLTLPVLLVVELISPGSVRIDRILKRDLYARAGIPHYWLVDTRDDHHHFEALELDGDAYRQMYQSDEHISVETPVAVDADLEDLFRPGRR